MLPPAERPVVLAAIAGAHGVAGDVRLKLFTAEGAAGLRRHAAFDADGLILTLLTVRDGPQGAIARFAEVPDRTVAERLRGRTLAVPRASLPPLPPGEHYWHDLIGLPVVAPDGGVLGVVVAVENFGASDLIEVERGDRGRVLVPLIPTAATVQPDRVILDAAWAAL